MHKMYNANFFKLKKMFTIYSILSFDLDNGQKYSQKTAGYTEVMETVVKII